MDALYENIVINMDEKKNTHPNIIKIWKKYLKYKKKIFVDDINQCNDVIQKLSTVNDLSTINIISLYILLNNRQ